MNSITDILNDIQDMISEQQAQGIQGTIEFIDLSATSTTSDVEVTES